MTLDELNTMTTEQMTRWLIDDAHSTEPQSDAVQALVLGVARAGTLTDDLRDRWIAANRRAGEHLQREAEQLRRYGAGIRGVIDGGNDAA